MSCYQNVVFVGLSFICTETKRRSRLLATAPRDGSSSSSHCNSCCSWCGCECHFLDVLPLDHFATLLVLWVSCSWPLQLSVGRLGASLLCGDTHSGFAGRAHKYRALVTSRTQFVCPPALRLIHTYHAVPMPFPCRVNSHMPCRAPAILRQCRVLRESPRGRRKYPNCI
jgi:hypothetical protein